MTRSWQARPADLGSRRNWRTVSRSLYRTGLYAGVIVIAMLFTGPFFWTVSSSLKRPSELWVFPPKWLPESPQWDNWVEVWRQVPFGRYVLNSCTITLSAMVGQIVSATLVAYGFARFRFPGRDLLFGFLLSTMLLPGQVTLIPRYLMFRQLKWLDSYKPLVWPHYFGGGAFFIFLLRQFFLTLPRALDESAKLDGAGPIRILVSILLPLCKPALGTVAIFSFRSNWNDFMGPLIYINTMEKFPLQIGLYYFKGVREMGGMPREHLLMAASLQVALPSILLFFFMQRYFVRGIVLSGLKG